MRRLIKQGDLFLNPTVQLAIAHKEKFPDEFIVWLKDNIHVWLAFEKQAKKVLERGFLRYSARTIVAFLRHHSLVREIDPENMLKINDHHSPYLGRLFELAHPQYVGLFEFRKTKKAYTENPAPSPYEKEASAQI